MMIHRLELLATDANWRIFMTRKADSAFQRYQSRVLSRDHNTCQYCGFQSQSLMEVVNLDRNYHHNKLENLMTACPLCAQCEFLESVGLGGYGGGRLIYFPELTQNKLNALCHMLFASIANATSFAPDAKNIYRSMRLRSQTVEKKCGEGFSNPAYIGRLIVESSDDKQRKARDLILRQLRLLPNLAKFAPLTEQWSIEGIKTIINA